MYTIEDIYNRLNDDTESTKRSDGFQDSVANDWRLPTIQELQTVVHYNYTGISGNTSEGIKVKLNKSVRFTSLTTIP